MAKDDYYAIVYKILVYFYACMKRKIVFDQAEYDMAIGKKHISEEYLAQIYSMMKDDGYLSGGSIIKTWGSVFVLASDESDFSITSKGIDYLQDNSKMKQVGEVMKNTVDVIANLASLVGLYQTLTV